MPGSKKEIQTIFGYPTATVIHSRVPMFQATRKVRTVTKWACKNAWGAVEVTGRLGQVHRDLHDLIMSHGKSYRLGELKDLHIVIDPAEIQRKMGVKSNPRFLERLLEDMRQARVTVECLDGRESLGGIVSVIDKKVQEVPGPGGFMKKRYIWLVTISRTWLQVYNSFMRVRYEPALPIILQMKSGYSQAMARFFLTHSGKMSMAFEDCLKILGVDREGKKVKQEIKHDLSQLEKIGIVIEGEMVRYVQQPGLVNFDNPRKEEKERTRAAG